MWGGDKFIGVVSLSRYCPTHTRYMLRPLGDYTAAITTTVHFMLLMKLPSLLSHLGLKYMHYYTLFNLPYDVYFLPDSASHQ